MANPQKENGYTPIANEIMDKLAKSPIRSEVRRVIDFILRKTYGFNKKYDTIALSQFEAGTEMKRSNICKALKEALCKRIIIKTENGYMFNKNVDEWVVCKRIIVMQTHNLGSMQTHNRVVCKRIHTKVDITKVDITKDSNAHFVENAFASFWELYPNKKSKKMAAAAWAKLSKVEKDSALAALPAHLKQDQWVKDDGRFIPHPTTWLNQRRWEDVILPTKTQQPEKSQSEIAYEKQINQIILENEQRNTTV